MYFKATLKNAFGKASSNFKNEVAGIEAKALNLESTIVPEVVQVTKEVPIEVIKEIHVPVEKIVEVIKEIPVEKIVEKIKEVPVYIEKRVEVPVEIIKEVEKQVPVFIDRIVTRVQTNKLVWIALGIETLVIIKLLFIKG